MNNTSLEAIIMSNCVRYEKLNSLIPYAYSGSTATELNIYIDLYSVIRSLFKPNTTVNIQDYKSITACIINICGHYREYFKKYLGVHTKIFLIMSYNCCDMNKKFVSNYNKSMTIAVNYNSFTGIVNDNMDLLNILCPYLPDIFFIRSNYESSVVMSYIIEKEISDGNNNPNMIVSKDPYMLQLCTMYPETSYLRPKKYNGEDRSFIIRPIRDVISMREFWDIYSDMRNISRDAITIHPYNISLLMALSRVPERELKSVFNTVTANRYISNVVGDSSTRCSVQSIFDINRLDENKTSIISISNRFKAIDIQFQSQIYKDTVESKMIKLRNLHDPTAVKQINDHYFYNDPLELDKL